MSSLGWQGLSSRMNLTYDGAKERHGLGLRHCAICGVGPSDGVRCTTADHISKPAHARLSPSGALKPGRVPFLTGD